MALIDESAHGHAVVLRAALVVWIGAWLALASAYLLSAYEGHVPVCVPILEGCTSISGAARHGIAWYAFKIIMAPVVIASVVFWLRIPGALEALVAERAPRWIGRLAIAATLALVVHVAALGLDGELARSFRRVGTIGYFIGTFAAHVGFVFASKPARARSWWRVMVALVVATPLLNVLLVSLGAMADDDDPFENVGEWNTVVFLSLFPFAAARLTSHDPARQASLSSS